MEKKSLIEFFGLPESLDADTASKLLDARTTLESVQTKYDAWKDSPNNAAHEDVDSYIKSYGERQAKEMADAESLRGSLI